MLSELRSVLTVRVQVHLGRPGGRLQWLGRPDMTVRSALVWSNFPSDLATCPNFARFRTVTEAKLTSRVLWYDEQMIVNTQRYVSRDIPLVACWANTG